MDLSFLQNVEVAVVEEAKTTTKSSYGLPTGNAIRVYASGKVFPSLDLVAKYNLEYTKKDAENSGNGFDIFKSTNWGGFPVNAPQTYLFIAAVPKTMPKVDLFSSCGYDKETGEPIASVTKQGRGSFGKELVELVKEVFGTEIEKGSFVDLTIEDSVKVEAPNGLYFIPKTITRGEKKGQMDAVRRENLTVNPLVLVTSDEEVQETVAAEETAVEAVVADAETEAVDVRLEQDSNPFEDKESAAPEKEVSAPGLPDFPEMPSV